MGQVKKELVMRRDGVLPGDKICVIGAEMGLFWAAVLKRLHPDIHLDETSLYEADNALFRPIPRIREGIALAESRAATACMDSSDGVCGCLHELANVNRLDLVIHSDRLKPCSLVQQAAQQADIDPRKLILSWGGWELVCTIRPEQLPRVKSLIESFGALFMEIGDVCEGVGKVWLKEEERTGPLANFASERFCGTSFFTHGLQSYMDFLRQQPLMMA